MNLTPIDSKNDLYLIKNIIPKHFLKQIDEIEVSALDYDKWDWFDHSRKKVNVSAGSVFDNVQQYLHAKKDELSSFLDFKINNIDSTFWIDQSGFTFPVHIDNPGVNVAMQIYLNNCSDADTTFYQISENDIETRDDNQHWHYVGKKPPSKVRHTFDFIQDTGYLMVNNKTQLHGVPGKLKDGQHRMSMYCWIN